MAWKWHSEDGYESSCYGSSQNSTTTMQDEPSQVKKQASAPHTRPNLIPAKAIVRRMERHLETEHVRHRSLLAFVLSSQTMTRTMQHDDSGRASLSTRRRRGRRSQGTCTHALELAACTGKAWCRIVSHVRITGNKRGTQNGRHCSPRRRFASVQTDFPQDRKLTNATCHRSVDCAE